MKKLKGILFNNKGSGFPLAVAITLCLVMIFSGVSEYFRLMIIAQGVRNALQDAVITTVNDNYDNVYHGVREGYSGGYQPIASNFQESIDYGDIYNQLDEILGLEQSGGEHVKYDSNRETQLKIYNLTVNIENAPIASGDTAGQRFEINSTIVLEVPVSFAGKVLPTMRIQVRNSAGYTPKF
ncbi:MAG: hypothetical protein CVU95_01380 [Firmicutes bacterium HGW-Firmicutes-2]|jgi:hypothetical protein|nr:MAG: hypothetical protein CVU95_01380 [Firmicutes bacterium HGW-Firmicutes-2]